MRLSKATLRSPALYNSCRLLSFFLIYDFCFSLYLPSFRETARRQCLFDAYVVTRVYADFRKHNYRLHIQPSRRDVKYGKTQLITHVASFSTHHISPSLSLSLSHTHTHTHIHMHACVVKTSLYILPYTHTHTRARPCIHCPYCHRTWCLLQGASYLLSPLPLQGLHLIRSALLACGMLLHDTLSRFPNPSTGAEKGRGDGLPCALLDVVDDTTRPSSCASTLTDKAADARRWWWWWRMLASAFPEPSIPASSRRSCCCCCCCCFCCSRAAAPVPKISAFASGVCGLTSL